MGPDRRSDEGVRSLTRPLDCFELIVPDDQVARILRGADDSDLRSTHMVSVDEAGFGTPLSVSRSGIGGDIALHHPDESEAELFVYADAETVFIASSIAALAAAAIPLEPSPYAIAHFLAYGVRPVTSTMWNDIHRLRPGATLLVGPGARVSSVAGASRRVRKTLAQWSRTTKGLQLAILAARDDPGARLLACAARGLRFESVIHSPPSETLDADQLIPIAERAIALTFEPPGSLAFPLLQAAIAAVSGGADALVSTSALTWGLDSADRLESFRRKIELFEQLDARSPGISQVTAARRGPRRDHYFDTISIFAEEDRLMLSGPRLLHTNCVSMADYLGLSLEEATVEEIVDACWRSDLELFIETGLWPDLKAIGRASNVMIDMPKPEHMNAARLGRATRRQPRPRPALAASSRLRDLLTPDCRLVTEGFLRPSPLLRVVEQAVADLQGQGTPRLLTLLSLELWLRQTEGLRS